MPADEEGMSEGHRMRRRGRGGRRRKRRLCCIPYYAPKAWGGMAQITTDWCERGAPSARSHLTSHLTSPHLTWGTRNKKMWENNKDKKRRYSRYHIMHPFSIVLLILVLLLLLHPPNIFDNTSMDNTYQLFSHHRHIWTNIVISRSIIILNLFSPLLVLRIGSCYVMRHTTQIPQTRVYSLYSGRIERINVTSIPLHKEIRMV